MTIQTCYIQATGIFTAAATNQIALLGAVANDIVIGKPNNAVALTKKTPGIPESPIIQANIDELATSTYGIRIFQFAVNSLASISTHIKPEHKTLLHIHLPPKNSWRYQQTNTDWLQAELIAMYPQLTSANWYWHPIENTGTQNLDALLPKLDEFDQVIFGGIDSLVDLKTCAEFGEQVQTEEQTDGLIPGEGAGFLLLSKIPSPYKLSAQAVAEEANHNEAQNKPMQGLMSAINTVMNKQTIDAIITPHNGEKQAELEWYQAYSRIWQNKTLPEQLHLQNIIGSLGAAELPIALTLACARLDYPYPPINNIIFCERPNTPWRAAIKLEKQTCLG